jgi:3-methyladenine DNA glycosylase/8-oxoguanine DNA glycosylase
LAAVRHPRTKPHPASPADGAPLADPTPHVTHRFPTPQALAEADPTTFGVDPTRARAISALAQRGLHLDAEDAAPLTAAA